MRNGFKFKGRHSSEFDVTVKTKSRPVFPSVRANLVELPFRDGEYDFSKANPYGREFYSDRIFTVSVCVNAENISDMQKTLSRISLWLCGEGELIFDDMPLVVWKGRVCDEVIYLPEHQGRRAVVEVSFRVRTFGECIFDSDGPFIDDVIALGECIPLDISAGLKYTIKKSAELTVYNFGDRPIRPVVNLSNSSRAVSLSNGEKTLSFTVTGAATVDFDKQRVLCDGKNIEVTGEFFELPAGTSTLYVTNSSQSELLVEIRYTPHFMYGNHFEDLDWGDA